MHSARILLENGCANAEQLIDIYQNVESKVANIAEQVQQKAKLENATDVMKSVIPPKLPSTRNLMAQEQREVLFSHEKHNIKKPQHLAKLLNWALLDLMAEYNNTIMLGEDIGKKGGVYNVTAKLCERHGKNRVLNTLLDEQSILGGAIGLAHNGFLPIPEIQFLAYVHNAEDQIRGEAATLSFFSKGQFTNPMVIRIAGLAYQKGFGGHFHNDNSLAVLRDIPGIIIACPSNGEDAVLMFRECVRLALEEQRIVVFIEPIALYMTRDLHSLEDGQWLAKYPHPSSEKRISVGQIGEFGNGEEIVIVTYANGYYLSQKALKILAEQHNINISVIDLRWLAPLNESVIIKALSKYSKVLIVDECRITGSQSEALMSLFIEQCHHKPLVKRLSAEDCFIPLGKAATVTLPSCESIVTAVLSLKESPEV